MHTTYSTALFISSIFVAEALSLPLVSPTSEETYSAAVLPLSPPVSSTIAKEMSGDPESDTMFFGVYRIHSTLSPEDAEISERSPQPLPIPNTHTLPRDGVQVDPNTSNTSIGSCQVAVGLLREDFAGHGLPLTSLVIESSTLLLLAGFVLYFFLWRCNFRRRSTVYLSTANTPVSFSFPHRDSTFKHTPPTPAQRSIASLSKIDEDSLPPTPTQSTPPFYSHLATLSPLRGTPSSPARAVSRAASFSPRSGAASMAGEGGGLEKKSSFLSLKG